MKDAELLVRMLERAGVRWVFGIPSGPVLPLIEALRKSAIEFILTASETSAGFMAQTVGKLTGVPGVCVSTMGPGATNLATGVGSAWLDRSPLLAITCNVGTPWLQRRVQMRIDHHLLFQPLTKASFPLREGQVATSFAEALAIVCTEPPGPVHMDLPEDVALAEATEALSEFESGNGLPDTSNEVAEKLSAELSRSRRPLLVTGLTFTRTKAPEQLLRFIETQNIPFVSTLHAKGFLPESHPNWVGVLGRARRTDVQILLAKADLIIAVGYDPVEINYEEWVGNTPVLHVSTETADVGTDVTMLLNKAGDLDLVIERMSKIAALPNDWSTAQWRAHRQTLEQSLRPDCRGLGLHNLLDVLRKKLPADAVLATDVGAHTHQIATQWRSDFPWTCLATNGWSSMGYGMPAAYAAKLVYPERAVVGIVGDGGFQMTVGEVALARRLGLAVPIIVLNDGWLGLMKVKQERKRYGLSGVYLGAPLESPPHYFGVPCRSAINEKTVGEAIDWGLSLNGPSIIEAFIDVEPYSITVFD
ncbi:MAG: thiamine pyrophosphate-binding protein [Candidatus Binatia bacterium]